MEHRFNLASDPWIPVYDKNLDQKLVSLRDLLAHSDIYRIDLSDIALMRFIAAAHWTVRYREGAGLPIGKRLPAAWVDDYLDRWHDRFDLEADPTPHDHTDRDAYDQHDRNDGGHNQSGLVLLPFGRVGDGSRLLGRAPVHAVVHSSHLRLSLSSASPPIIPHGVDAHGMTAVAGNQRKRDFRHACFCATHTLYMAI